MPTAEGFHSAKSALLTLVLSSTLALGVAELALRIVLPAPSPAGLSANCENAELYGWGFPPHHGVQTYDPDLREVVAMEKMNSRGWKDRDHGWRKPPGAIRILIVGDSYTFGVTPMTENFPIVLESLLKARGLPVEVISIGFGGWGSDQKLKAYLHEGRRYSPDIVIAQFCGNDLFETAGVGWVAANQTKPFRYSVVGNSLMVERNHQWIGGSSIAAQFLKSTRIHYLFQMAKHSLMNPSASEENSEAQWFIKYKPTAEGIWKKGRDSEDVRQLWKLYGLILSNWAGECHKDGSLFYVFSETGEPGDLEFYLKWDHLRRDGDRILARSVQGGWEEIDYFKWRTRHNEICRNHGVTPIPQKRTYRRYEWDPHTNAEGNRAIARDIRDFLVANPESAKVLGVSDRHSGAAESPGAS